ncbi:MAG: Ppx/GppA family phosphatase [Rubritepida sp.]|jgi:exopolyphosphatase/guanosine-5'-triphosphate,3'-diphosphate pyrophosphatase|nr:Ppx/GppA family phosphatase [Rubritepida sp.]
MRASFETTPPQHTHRVPSPALYAALDLGTNNCRLLIGAPTRHGFRVVESFSRVVRLGEGLASTGTLSAPAMERTLAALSACADRLERRPVRRLAAVATEACRRAANGVAFLGRAAAETGLRPRIISPREEAELAMESCAPLLDREDRRAILFDIGGGSTEIAWVRNDRRPELIGYISIPSGVVTLAEGEDCFSPQGFESVVDRIAAQLEAFDRLHCIGQEIRAGGVRLIGTSGTVTTLAGVVMALPRYSRPLVDGRRIDAAAADAALVELFAMGRRGLVAHPCVGPERAEYVLPGCAVYAAIRRLWPLPEVTVADRGLREGMLLRLMRGD